MVLIKRRKSIRASGSDVRQKKPTTANRGRLEAAIAAVQRLMPRVYADSVVSPAELAKFPWDEEREMLDHEERVDMSEAVRIERTVFSEWLRFGRISVERCFCAKALMRYALDQQGLDLRGAVTGDTAWELCCRLLSHPAEAKSLGTRELAQLLVYWLEEGQLPTEMRPDIYKGMVEDLHGRGKRVETRDDEKAMKCRWVRQQIHEELDLTREAWLGSAQDVPVDLEVDFDCRNSSRCPSPQSRSRKPRRCLRNSPSMQSTASQDSSVTAAPYSRAMNGTNACHGTIIRARTGPHVRHGTTVTRSRKMALGKAIGMAATSLATVRWREKLTRSPRLSIRATLPVKLLGRRPRLLLAPRLKCQWSAKGL